MNKDDTTQDPGLFSFTGRGYGVKLGHGSEVETEAEDSDAMPLQMATSEQLQAALIENHRLKQFHRNLQSEYLASGGDPSIVYIFTGLDTSNLNNVRMENEFITQTITFMGSTIDHSRLFNCCLT